MLTQHVLGHGGQAKVISGIENKSTSYVAVKVANSGLLDKQINIVKEGNIIKQLDHPNIIQCFDVFEPSDEDPKAYVVMERMQTSLYDFLEWKGRFREQKAKRIFYEIVKGVFYCHTSGVIHHDLKLENVLVNFDKNGAIKNVKITDFGLSKKTSDVLVGITDG